VFKYKTSSSEAQEQNYEEEIWWWKKIWSEPSVIIIIAVLWQNVARLEWNVEPICLCESRQNVTIEMIKHVKEGVNYLWIWIRYWILCIQHFKSPYIYGINKWKCFSDNELWWQEKIYD
jgi:hypothetical protein